MRDYTKVMDAETREKWGIQDLDDHDLESASATVAHLTRAAIYQTTPDGYPTGDLADVFAAATAAQAVYTAETGDPTGAAAESGSVSLGPLSLTSRPGGGQRSAQARMAALYAPKALEILAANSLLNGTVGNSAWG
ncbi:hypothetical protein [Brachybacterium massiliense]|uniref:hypothetical protein n=1 Tax=Brachybacterium massiliense TaxID=1755098 RepID=UPI000B3BC25C|nr:hypothetical protein [Brachybacterium massiliense]